MGMVVNGEWQDHTSEAATPNVDAKSRSTRNNRAGEFVRSASTFRHWLGDPETPYSIESSRYHLFVNAGCPWAYRTILYRAIKGLENIVTISYTEAGAGPQGWTFGDLDEPLVGAKHMHHVYSHASPTFTGRATVPVLWDKQTATIVNNESADIIRMFNSVFDDLDGVTKLDYYPTQLATEIDTLNEEIYNNINNGVYRCGFAQAQAAYDEAFELLFASLDRLDTRLAKHRFLCGDSITEADWRLFSTLVRFDLAYYGQFKCNRNLLSAFENLWPYTRDLYQTPGVAKTVDIAAIKGIYYGSRAPRILPQGPLIDFSAPHKRSAL